MPDSADSSRVRIVALPGTGSDDDYVRRAFGPAAAALGVDLITPPPTADLVDGHLAALDAAAQTGPVLVGGVSIGAAIAVSWALRAAARAEIVGVLAALPPWSGAPDHAPAAASARLTADSLRRVGLRETIAEMQRSSPRWLADELTRSWSAIGADLDAQLRQAARHHCPTPEEVSGLTVPMVVIAAIDDPIHPIDVGRSWHAAAPRSTLREVTLAEWGADPGILGRLGAQAWLDLAPDRPV